MAENPVYIPPEVEDVVIMDQPKSYWSSQPSIRMHRKDGIEIIFLHHYFETDEEATAKYLDNEIRLRNQFIRHATEEEIKNAHFRMNPKAEMRKELSEDPEFVEELRRKWEAEQTGTKSLGGVDTPPNTTQTREDPSGAKIVLDEPAKVERTPAEILADIHAKKAAEKDLGASNEGKFKPGSTASIAEGGAGPSNSAASGPGASAPGASK